MNLMRATIEPVIMEVEPFIHDESIFSSNILIIKFRPSEKLYSEHWIKKI